MSMKLTRVCALPGCEVAIVRKNGETMQNFRKRKYCCRKHAVVDVNQKRKRKEEKHEEAETVLMGRSI